MPKADSYVGKSLRLSPRESEVLMWTACGKTGGEIAKFLALSEETVRSHIRNACIKLDAVNKTHAAAIALVHGVLIPGPSPERVIPLSALFGLSRQSTHASETSPTPKPKRNSNG